MNAMTIKEVARLAGVSVSTISRVINNRPDVRVSTRERVRQIIDKHGFVPSVTAKTLKQSRTNIIGLVVKGISNPFFPPIVERIQQEISKTNYIPLVHYIDEDDDEVRAAYTLTTERKALGIIFLGGNPAARPRSAARLKVPCVIATSSVRQGDAGTMSSVCVDNVASAGKAVDLLVKHGHRVIAVLGGRLSSRDIAEERLAGVRQRLFLYGLEFDNRLYIEAKFTLQDSYDAVYRALSGQIPPFTALFAMSDIMAIGAIRAIFDKGLRVPEDVSVIGFDGIEITRFYNPTLTTIRQPCELIAKNCSDLIIKNIHGENLGTTVVLETEIQPGASVCDSF